MIILLYSLLVQLQGSSFELVHTDETVIISASSHPSLSPLGFDYAEVESLKATNALYLSSLENAGVDGDPSWGYTNIPMQVMHMLLRTTLTLSGRQYLLLGITTTQSHGAKNHR